MNEPRQLKAGDQIRAMGLTFTIGTIWYQHWYDMAPGGWDVEFLDDKNNYHHWKQDEDGGEVIYNV